MIILKIVVCLIKKQTEQMLTKKHKILCVKKFKSPTGEFVGGSYAIYGNCVVPKGLYVRSDFKSYLAPLYRMLEFVSNLFH